MPSCTALTPSVLQICRQPKLGWLGLAVLAHCGPGENPLLLCARLATCGGGGGGGGGGGRVRLASTKRALAQWLTHRPAPSRDDNPYSCRSHTTMQWEQLTLGCLMRASASIALDFMSFLDENRLFPRPLRHTGAQRPHSRCSLVQGCGSGGRGRGKGGAGRVGGGRVGQPPHPRGPTGFALSAVRSRTCRRLPHVPLAKTAAAVLSAGWGRSGWIRSARQHADAIAAAAGTPWSHLRASPATRVEEHHGLCTGHPRRLN